MSVTTSKSYTQPSASSLSGFGGSLLGSLLGFGSRGSTSGLTDSQMAGASQAAPDQAVQDEIDRQMQMEAMRAMAAIASQQQAVQQNRPASLLGFSGADARAAPVIGTDSTSRVVGDLMDARVGFSPNPYTSDLDRLGRTLAGETLPGGQGAGAVANAMVNRAIASGIDPRNYADPWSQSQFDAQGRAAYNSANPGSVRLSGALNNAADTLSNPASLGDALNLPDFFAAGGAKAAGYNGPNIGGNVFDNRWGAPDTSANNAAFMAASASPESMIGSYAGAPMQAPQPSQTLASSTPIPRPSPFKTAQGQDLWSVTPGANLQGVDPRLVDALKYGAFNTGTMVQAFSGKKDRSTGTTNHISGRAVDMNVIDPATGQALPNYQNAASLRPYEKYAQAVRSSQMTASPELAEKMRWGGYFAGGVNPRDLMHFDISGKLGLGMAGGSWEGGATPQQLAAYGKGAVSQGMGAQPSVAMAQAPNIPGLGNSWQDMASAGNAGTAAPSAQTAMSDTQPSMWQKMATAGMDAADSALDNIKVANKKVLSIPGGWNTLAGFQKLFHSGGGGVAMAQQDDPSMGYGGDKPGVVWADHVRRVRTNGDSANQQGGDPSGGHGPWKDREGPKKKNKKLKLVNPWTQYSWAYPTYSEYTPPPGKITFT